MFPMLCLCLFRRIDLSSVKTLRMMDRDTLTLPYSSLHAFFFPSCTIIESYNFLNSRKSVCSFKRHQCTLKKTLIKTKKKKVDCVMIYAYVGQPTNMKRGCGFTVLKLKAKRRIPEVFLSGCPH